MSKVKNVLAIPDLHAPVHDVRSLKAVEEVMGGERWDEIVQIGDFMDHNSISSHNIGKLRKVEGQTLQADYDVGNSILDRWQKLAPKAKLTILQGNHDERPERLVDAQPQLRGRVETEHGLHLKKRGINWVPWWRDKRLTYQIGNAHFIHGLYTNQYHAAKHAARWGVNVFYGHLHDVQGYSVVLQGEDKTIVGQSLGCLCEYNQDYLQGAPSAWQQAFGAFHFFADGFFTYNVVRIFRHRFYYGGQVFQG